MVQVVSYTREIRGSFTEAITKPSFLGGRNGRGIPG